MGIISSYSFGRFLVVAWTKISNAMSAIKVESGVAINMLEQRASDLSSLPCACVFSVEFCHRFYTNLGILVKQISGVKSLKTPRFESFPSVCPQPSECTGTELSFKWAQCGGRVSWVQCAAFGRLDTAGPDTGPCQFSWQQTSWIPWDYRNIWTHLNINLRPYSFFPIWNGEQSDWTKKCLWSEAKLKRSDIVVLHLYFCGTDSQINLWLNIYYISSIICISCF